MNPLDIILDQPQTIDYQALSLDQTSLLANHDLRFQVDAASDLHDLFWPWADATYVRSITLTIQSLGSDPLTPLTNLYYPGYQETILGSEGVIVSKRLLAPLRSGDDRAVVWLLDCQAEGDHLLRLEVTIDWGEPLTQRLVDGLLLAQRNPGEQRGVYSQSNAESTRVFGNPHARPDQVDMADPQRARLVYHLLINGEVQESLLLTVSDVGEQVAWGAFLGLRDSIENFEKLTAPWESLLRQGRLWTPDVRLNQQVQAGRIATVRHLQQVRSGWVPFGRELQQVPLLVNSLDAFDLTQSRNLLAHLRRLAEATEGKLPIHFPLSAKFTSSATHQGSVQGNAAYLSSLWQHLQRHFDADLLDSHYPALTLCAEELIRTYLQPPQPLRPAELLACAHALRQAAHLAAIREDAANQQRWEQQANAIQQVIARQTPPPTLSLPQWQEALDQSTWRVPAEQPAHFADPWRGIELAGLALWQGCGVRWIVDQFFVSPTWPLAWQWWALLDLPTAQGKLSLVWDGERLHSTLPVQSRLTVQVHSRIRALGFEEHDFAPRFEFFDDVESETGRMSQKTNFAAHFIASALP